MIHRFKFSGHRRLAHPLACLLEEAYRKRPNPFSPSCLVPVPSHPRRLRKRGFDQTLLLTRTLGRRLNLPLFRGLRRSRPTLPQFGLDLKARRRNIRNAFRLRQARRLKGEDLVLVDDILTTGATAREISKVLKRDGRAGRILVLTVARVALPGETPEAASRSGGVLAAEERRHPCRRLDRRLSGADQGSQGGRQSLLQPTPQSEMQAHLIEVRILELEPGIGSGESHGPR